MMFPSLNISNPRIVEVPRVPQALTVTMLNIVCDVHSFRFQEGLCVYSCAYITYKYSSILVYIYIYVHIDIYIY